MSDISCFNCRHWDAILFDDGLAGDYGQCTRFPPVYVAEMIQWITGKNVRRRTVEEITGSPTAWRQPVTCSYDMCGEWKQKD